MVLRGKPIVKRDLTRISSPGPDMARTGQGTIPTDAAHKASTEYAEISSVSPSGFAGEDPCEGDTPQAATATNLVLTFASPVAYFMQAQAALPAPPTLVHSAYSQWEIL